MWLDGAERRQGDDQGNDEEQSAHDHSLEEKKRSRTLAVSMEKRKNPDPGKL
jgi:hypothetical protein